MWTAIKISFGLLCLGGFLLYTGWKEYSLAKGSKSSATELTLRQLIDEGPGDNLFVRITDFQSGSNYVGKEKRGQIEHVYVPIIPDDEALQMMGLGGRVPPVKALVYCTLWKDAGEVGRGCVSPLQGMIVNGIDSVGDSEGHLLRKHYPTTDLTKCIIIEAGREPPGPGKIYGLLGGGAGSLLVGLGLLTGPFLMRFMSGNESSSKRRKRLGDDDDDDA